MTSSGWTAGPASLKPTRGSSCWNSTSIRPGARLERVDEPAAGITTDVVDDHIHSGALVGNAA